MGVGDLVAIPRGRGERQLGEGGRSAGIELEFQFCLVSNGVTLVKLPNLSEPTVKKSPLRILTCPRS